MINDPVLINEWHVVGRSADLVEGQIKPARLLGEDLVLWRLNGQVMAWQDLCVHRGTSSACLIWRSGRTHSYHCNLRPHPTTLMRLIENFLDINTAHEVPG